MLTHCINELCNRPLHSAGAGRLFQFEITSISLAAMDEALAPFDEKPQRETAHFRLSGPCASRLTVLLEPARGLRLISIGQRDPALELGAALPDGWPQPHFQDETVT